MSKKYIKFIPLLILSVGISMFLILMWSKDDPEVAPSRADIAVVETTRLQAQSGIIQILGDGFVRPRSEVLITPQVSGRVIAVGDNMISGGQPNAGETLLQIDPTPFQADLDQAVANHDASLATLHYLSKQYARSETLFKRADISQAQLDDTYAKLKQVEADVRRFDALIVRRQFDLDQTHITLPFNARIVEENVDVGDTVSIGQQLARAYERGSAEITVSLTEKDAALIPNLWSHRPGDNGARDAVVTAVFSGQTYQWDAYLDRVNAGLNMDTRTIDVVVAVANPQIPGRAINAPAEKQDAPPLLIGIYAKVALSGRNLPRYYTIPSQAVHKGPSIWVATKHSTLAIIPVDHIRDAEGSTIITVKESIDGLNLIVSDLAIAIEHMPLVVSENADIPEETRPKETPQ